MRSRILLAALGVLAVPALAAPAQARVERGASLAGYVVVLDSGADPAATSAVQSKRYGVTVERLYRRALSGYAAQIPADRVSALRADPAVVAVEPDVDLTALGQQLPWGIDRVDADLSSTEAGDGSGSVTGVNVYVIDSGVSADAFDLNVVDRINLGTGPDRDCNGHGTHVAGILAAQDDGDGVVGVAPGAPVTAVKVLGCNGNGKLSALLAGIDWVTANAVKPAVANFSVGGPPSQALDDAVRASVASGVFYALAAGNDGADACNLSPSRVGAGAANGVATVAATDSSDEEASFSDFGSCVDLWAPGVQIASLGIKKKDEIASMSGTSMAAPHVAGAAALYLSAHPSASPAAVESALVAASVATGTTSKDGRAIRLAYAGTF